MSPERVLALLKAENSVPEPLEPTPGHTPTRVFDPEEVSSAQRESAEPPASRAKPSSQAQAMAETKSSARTRSSPADKQPFEIVESVPARPPSLPADLVAPMASTQKRPRSDRPALMRRFKRMAGLAAMAILVFATTFLLTKGLRDEGARVRAWELITLFGEKLGGWFSSQAEPPEPKTSSNVLAARPDSKSGPAISAPAAAPTAAVQRRATRAADPKTPVVRLEDLAVLDECTAPDCPSTPNKSASKQRRALRSRAP
jgi:hypothetical protein